MARRWVPPAFCRGLDCPVFDVLHRTTGYELRHYLPSRWVTCEMRTPSYNEDGGLFNKLFRYISGYNSTGQKIEMTVPVLICIRPGQGATCDSTVSMSFYIPPGMVAPQPADSSVHLTELPSMTVYVRSFGGFMNQADAARQASQLAQAVGDPAAFDSRQYFTAGYDSPFRVDDRHNEVWLLKR